jgi:hypothetical protein
MTAVRPEVVALFLGADFDASDPPRQFVHSDGRPFTRAEHRLILSATFVELEAVRTAEAAMLDFHATRAADARRVVELIEPYTGGLPDDVPLSTVLARMPDGERVVVSEILDRAAPDGQLILGGAE